MADEVATMAALEGVLKEDYIKEINEQFSLDAPLESRLENNTEDVVGLEGVMSLNMAPNLGVGWGDEDGYIPDAGYPLYKKVRIQLKAFYGSFQITGRLLQAGKSELGAFAPVLSRIMDDLVKAMRKVKNTYNHLDGSGVIARVTAAASTLLTVDRWSPLFEDTRKIDTYNGKGTSDHVHLDGVKISSFNKANKTITTASAGGEVGDFIYLKDSRNNCQMGLLGVIDDGTFLTTFQNLSRTTYQRWKAKVLTNGGTTRNLTERLLMDASAICKNVNLWVGTPLQLNDLVSELQLQRRFVTQNPKGNKALIRAVDLGGGREFLEDEDALPGYTMGINKSTISYYTGNGGKIQWMKEPGAGNILQQVRDGTGKKDSLEATAYLYTEMGCNRCNENVRLEDIAENAPSGY